MVTLDFFPWKPGIKERIKWQCSHYLDLNLTCVYVQLQLASTTFQGAIFLAVVYLLKLDLLSYKCSVIFVGLFKYHWSKIKQL